MTIHVTYGLESVSFYRICLYKKKKQPSQDIAFFPTSIFLKSDKTETFRKKTNQGSSPLLYYHLFLSFFLARILAKVAPREKHEHDFV